jgi:hypothetical protein
LRVFIIKHDKSIKLPFNELPLGFLHGLGALLGSLKRVTYVFGPLKTIDPIKLIFFPMRIGAHMLLEHCDEFAEVAQNQVLHPHPKIQHMYTQ